MYTNVHSSVLHNSHKMETAQTSMNWWMGTENRIYPYVHSDTQSCSTLCHPMDHSPPGFSVCGILLAGILAWAAFRVSSWPRDQTCISSVSCIGRWVLYHQHHLGSPAMHIIEYYSLIKRNEVLIHATTQMNLENITLSDRSLTQKDRYHMIHLKETYRISKSIEIENRSEVFRDWAEQGMERLCDWV